MLQTGELCDLKLKGNDFSRHHDAMVLASLSDEFAIEAQARIGKGWTLKGH